MTATDAVTDAVTDTVTDTVTACLFDFAFPSSCGDEIVRMLKAAGVATVRCVSTAALFPGYSQAANLTGCDVVAGLEASSLRALSLDVGPAYNSTPGLGVLVPTVLPPPDAWTFLSPFSLGVWLLLLAVVGAVIAAQLLTPRAAGGFTGVNTALLAVSAMIGSSRFYSQYDAAYLNHATSMALAVFSVFMTALYQSNLVAFFIPQRVLSDVEDLSQPMALGVHWVHMQRVADELGHRFAANGVTLHAVRAMPTDPAFVIAPKMFLAPFCGDGVHVTAVVAGKPVVLYFLGFARGLARDVVREVSSRVAAQIPLATYPVLPEACDFPSEATFGLAPVSLWGLFLVIAVGMGWSLVTRVVRAVRHTDNTIFRALFGSGFRWTDRKRTIVVEAPMSTSSMTVPAAMHFQKKVFRVRSDPLPSAASPAKETRRTSFGEFTTPRPRDIEASV